MTKRIIVPLLAAASILGAANAEAQGRAVPRGSAGSAYSRHPRPDGFFSARFVHQNVRFHFFAGRWGYVYDNFFYDPFCGPYRWSIGEIRHAQAMNWYRPPYTVGEIREMEYRYSAPGYTDGFARREDNRVAELEARVRQLENEAAERRGYERGIQEREAPAERPAPEPVQPKEEKGLTRKHLFEYSEEGYICPEQFVSTGNHLLNNVFSDYYESTGVKYTAREHKKNGKDATIIRDDKNTIVRDIDYSVFEGIPSGREFVGYVDSLLRSMDIHREDFRTVEYSSWSPRRCGTLY